MWTYPTRRLCRNPDLCMEKEKDKKISELDAQMRLAEILTDSTRDITLGGKTYKIRALRPGTQWLIAQESCKIAKSEEGNFTDLITKFAANIPAVVRCITLAILNDKAKIESDEYQALYDTIMWETKQHEWIGVLVEVLQMLDLSFFFRCTETIAMIRSTTLTKKNHEV